MPATKILLRFFLLAAILLLPLHRQLTAEKADRSPTSVAGERLVFKIEWDPPWYFFLLPTMEAGEAELLLMGDSEYGGRKAMKVSFKGHSSGLLVKMVGMKIEDEFTFFADPDTFCTMSAASRIREGKRRRQIDVQYLSNTRQLHIREVDESLTPPKVRKDETKDNIPECVYDPFSALYRLRGSELREGFSQTFMMANDDKIKSVKATVEKQESMTLPSGKTAVWRVGVTSLMGGLFKEGGQFKVWLSADEDKVPVQFEVKVKLGRVLGRLKP